MLKKIKILSFLTTFIFILLSSSLVSASSNIIYITPQTTSVNQGASFSVELRIDPNTSINAVQADVNYNSSIIQFNSLSLGAFSLCPQQSGGGGLVQISCATTGSVSSDSLVANINFTAIAGGTSGLNLSNYNAADSSTSAYTNPSAQNGSVNVASSPSAPSSSSSSSPTVSYKPKYTYSSTTQTPNTTTNQPAPQAIPIKISSLSSRIYFSIGQITISCNENVSGTLKYGLNPKNLTNQINGSSNSSTQSFNLNPSNLTAGTKYYYQITLNGPNGATYTSPLKSFLTKGLNVKLLVLGLNDKNVQNFKVYIDNSKKYLTTNSNGILNLLNMSPGIHKINYVFNNKSYSESFYIQNVVISSGNKHQYAPTQNLAIILSAYKQLAKNNNWIWILVIALILIIILYYSITKLLKNKNLIKDLEFYKDLKIRSHKE